MYITEKEEQAIALLLSCAGFEPGGNMAGISEEVANAINRTMVGDDLMKNYAQKYPTICANLIVRAMAPIQLSAFISAFLESYRNKEEE